MRSPALAAACLVALASYAASAASPSADQARAERELLAARRTRDLVALKLGAREAELAHRVRALYKLVRAGHAPLWTDERARSDLTRRRAAARRLILRDLEERQLLRDELDRAETQAARLERDVATLAAASPAPLPARSLLPPVGGRRTGDYGPAIDLVTHGRIVRRGVSWRTIDGAVVSAPLAGTVTFVGPLHGLGHAVLIIAGGANPLDGSGANSAGSDGANAIAAGAENPVDPGEDVTVLVTGIARLEPGLRPGVVLRAGARLGVATVGQVGLELRRDARTLDPTPFLSNPR